MRRIFTTINFQTRFCLRMSLCLRLAAADLFVCACLDTPSSLSTFVDFENDVEQENEAESAPEPEPEPTGTDLLWALHLYQHLVLSGEVGAGKLPPWSDLITKSFLYRCCPFIYWLVIVYLETISFYFSSYSLRFQNHAKRSKANCFCFHFLQIYMSSVDSLSHTLSFILSFSLSRSFILPFSLSHTLSLFLFLSLFPTLLIFFALSIPLPSHYVSILIYPCVSRFISAQSGSLIISYLCIHTVCRYNGR
jgi:hypothetical protein